MAVFHDAGAEEHVDSADFGDEMEFSDSELDEQPAATGGGAAMGGPAPTAAGSTTTAPAAGGAVAARNNATFKADACAAFVQMGLHADSSIPHAQVLARPPDAASAGRDRCPPPLWALIQTITDLNARCNVEKNSKVSPDEVREQLLRLHPGKFCLPGVWAPQNFSLRWARRKQMAALVGVCAAVLPADVFRVVDEMVEGLPKSTLPSCLQQ